MFSEALKDYALLRPDLLQIIEELNKHFKKPEAFYSEVLDPGSQFLKTCTPCETPREIRHQRQQKQKEDFERLKSRSTHSKFDPNAGKSHAMI